jgi:hypothetical protein
VRGGRLRQTSFQRRDTTPDARDKSTGRKGSFTQRRKDAKKAREKKPAQMLCGLLSGFAPLREIPPDENGTQLQREPLNCPSGCGMIFVLKK